MSFLSSFLSWMDAAAHRARLEANMDDEMRFHIEQRSADLARNGMPREAALRQAQREFGALDVQKEECRDSLGLRLWDELLSDIRIALRGMKNNPGFVFLALLCLTVGIGANTVVFSWIEGSVLRPYPAVPNQNRLMVLAGTSRGSTRYEEVSWPDFLDLQRNCTLIDAFIAEKITGATFSIGDRADRATGSMVSASYFDALGVRPVLGRGFQKGEDTGRNAHPVVVISYQLWKDRFHGDPSVIGRQQMLNGVQHTIIGVAPQGFYGTFVGYAWQFWVPASMQERFDSSGYKLEDRGARWIEGFVTLKPGVTLAQAQQEVSAVAQRLEVAYPDTNRGRGIQLLPLWQAPFNNTRVLLPTLGITLVVVFFVLLIACANVSNLLLVKAFGRRHEMTVRLALGAGRARLIKQLLTEAVILSLFGAAGGLLVANWCRNLLPFLMPPRGVPMYIPGEIDWHVMALSAGACLLATVFFGLVPALQSSNIDLAGSLKCESAGVVGGRGKSWIRSALVLGQVALSFTLLVGAGLLLESVQRIRTASPGFSTNGIFLTTVNLFAAGYDNRRARIFDDQLMDRVQSIPGVQAAAYARIPPFSYVTYSNAPVTVDGYEPPPDQRPTVDYDEVSPGYFDVMGIPLASGRDFTRADDEHSLPVAIVNQTLAARYWRGADPIGKRLQLNDKWLVVVGVAKDSKYSGMMEESKPFFYVPLRQKFSTLLAVVIRSSADPGTLATALAGQIHNLDPEISPSRIVPMREQVDQQSGSQQIAVKLLTVFGMLALLLAAVGLYGVMSYSVSQSGREMGMRMALGAGPSDLMRLVVSRGLWLTGCGILIGAAAALMSTRLLGYLLFQVSPRDPVAFGSAFAVMALAALAACFFPARRAGRTDPLQALRLGGN